MAASKNLLVYCGPNSIKSKDLAACIQLLVTHYASYGPLLLETERFGLNSDAITLAQLNFRSELWGMTDLLQTLYMTGRALASDPRDKVYAILELSKDGRDISPKPDYSLSVEEIYTRLAASIISQTRSLDILCLAGDAVFSRSPIYSLPSWVPDWTHRVDRTLNSAIRDASLTCAAGTSKAVITISDRFHTLTAKSYCLGEVDGLSCLLPTEDRLEDIHFGLVQPKYSHNMNTTDLENLIALSCSLVGNSRRLHDGKALAAFIQLCRWSEENGEALPPDNDTEGLVQFREWYRHNDVLVIGMRTLRDLIRHRTLLPDDIVLDTYLQEVYVYKCHEIFNGKRRVFTTTRGNVGLAPRSALPGDKAVILLGCNIPLILRPCGLGYQVIGECYLHNVMKGESMSDLEKGIFLLKDFVIH